MITSASLNLVGQVNKLVETKFEPPMSFDVPIIPVPVQPVKIAIPLNTFQQHLLEMFFQPKMGEMEIDEMPAQIKI